jgi:hypothetical protein
VQPELEAVQEEVRRRLGLPVVNVELELELEFGLGGRHLLELGVRREAVKDEGVRRSQRQEEEKRGLHGQGALGRDAVGRRWREGLRQLVLAELSSSESLENYGQRDATVTFLSVSRRGSLMLEPFRSDTKSITPGPVVQQKKKK